MNFHHQLSSLMKLTQWEQRGTCHFALYHESVIFYANHFASFSLCRAQYCRYDANSGGEREIQRTMLELLNQLDGFDARGDVKVILATNKIESLDPALLRPGRIDRKIEFPLPDIKTRRRIFTVRLKI